MIAFKFLRKLMFTLLGLMDADTSKQGCMSSCHDFLLTLSHPYRVVVRNSFKKKEKKNIEIKVQLI